MLTGLCDLGWTGVAGDLVGGAGEEVVVTVMFNVVFALVGVMGVMVCGEGGEGPADGGGVAAAVGVGVRAKGSDVVISSLMPLGGEMREGVGTGGPDSGGGVVRVDVGVGRPGS